MTRAGRSDEGVDAKADAGRSDAVVEAKASTDRSDAVIDAKPRTDRSDGRVRAVVDAVRPAIDGGRFAAKRVVGTEMVVEADCFADGHDALRVTLCWRAEGDERFAETEMTPLGNDVWRGSFPLRAVGRYGYTVTAWVDHLLSWRRELERRVDVADIRIAALFGAALIEETAARAHGADRKTLAAWAAHLRRGAAGDAADVERLKDLALDEENERIAAAYPDRRWQTMHAPELALVADRPRAQFSAWYELFPRSAAKTPGRHGTLRDVEARLPYVAALGFDVLYLPPIHPIGRIKRKGRNNTLTAQPADVGSPWAIGAEEGGHTAILPELGTLDDFRRLIAKAAEQGLEIALDIAFQCAPDHPWVKEHPGWFRSRPDGTVQYAENPPKKYQDIYPFNFESDDWRGLWNALKGVFEFWIEQGVTIFRVDNPHTKSFAFWQWAIGELKKARPELVFLAEAFTRPKVMHRLAKLGYTQSYTYFTWRNSKRELVEYFTELTQGPGREYFRPNVWPNTPDILHAQLHGAGRPVFLTRFLLAATLSANYGLYGPAYELLEGTPREPGSEEYLDSEKYQLRHWNLDRAGNLADFIAKVNRIRRENPALHGDWSLRFCNVDNDQLIAYAKRSGDNVIVVVVNLDPGHVQSGWVELDLAALGVEATSYPMHDLLSGQTFAWAGPRNFVILDPAKLPAHVMRLGQRPRNERDFDAPTAA